MNHRAEMTELSKIYDALKAADVEFSALSTNGINVFGDRKSIDAINRALNRDAQFDGICTNLRHWQEECGKLHARLSSIADTIKRSDLAGTIDTITAIAKAEGR